MTTTDAMAETKPQRKRGRPPGSRAQKPPPPPIPDIFIPTAFSRSGRPIKMKELADGTHFGLMAVKQEPVVVQDSPSPPPANKPRLVSRSSGTKSPGRPRKGSGRMASPASSCTEKEDAAILAPHPSASPEKEGAGTGSPDLRRGCLEKEVVGTGSPGLHGGCLEKEGAGTGSPDLHRGCLEKEGAVKTNTATSPNGYPRIEHTWSMSTVRASVSPHKKDTEMRRSAPANVSPEKEVGRRVAEDGSVGDIYLLRMKAGSKLPQRRKVLSRPISDGRNTVLVRTRTPENDHLEIKIERNERRVPAKVLKEEVMKLKVKIENGEPLPPVVQKCIDQVLEEKRKAIRSERAEMFARKDRVAKELEHIYLMAECDLLIKDSLSRPQWDHSKCLGAFRKLWSVPVTRQMLLKFPKAFETARHVCAVIEDLEAELDPATVDLDQETVARHHICEAAKKVYELYSSVFPYYEDKNFWSYFVAEIERYQEAASSMSTYDYYSSDRLPGVNDEAA